MKRRTKLHRVVVLAVLATLSVLPAAAQSHGFRASVPFDFSVGSQALPAGTYQFQRPLGQPSAKSEVGMIALRQMDGSAYSAVVTALARPSQDRDKQQPDTRLVFKKHAGQWKLYQVWIGGDARGQQLRNVSQGTDAVLAADEQVVAIAELR